MNAAYKKERVKIERFAYFETEKERGALDKGMLYASEAKNCFWGNGALRRGLGMRLFERKGEAVKLGDNLPGPKRFFSLRMLTADPTKSGTFGMIGQDGGIYVYNDYTHTFSKRATVEGEFTTAFAYDLLKENCVVFGTENGIYTYKETAGLKKACDCSKVRALCFAGGRLFAAVEPAYLWYSAPFEPLDFSESLSEGGGIAFPNDKGEIRALAQMQDRLFVFFERGIFVLEYAGDAREFVLKEVDYFGGKIIANSVGVCTGEKDKAYFLTENGVCVFDGTHVKNAAENLRIKVKSGEQVCVHFEFDGKYYLQFTQENGTARAIVVDNKTDFAYDTFFVDAFGFWNGDAIFSKGKNVYVFELGGDLFEEDTARYFVQETDFGMGETKGLTRLILKGEGGVEISVTCGLKKKTKKVILDREYALPIGFKGKKFGIEISLDKGARVTALEAEIEYLHGNVKGVLL